MQLAFMHITHTPCGAQIRTHTLTHTRTALNQAFRDILAVTLALALALPASRLQLRLCQVFAFAFCICEFVIKFQVQFEFIGFSHSISMHPLPPSLFPLPPVTRTIAISLVVCVIQPIWLAQLVILRYSPSFLIPYARIIDAVGYHKYVSDNT